MRSIITINRLIFHLTMNINKSLNRYSYIMTYLCKSSLKIKMRTAILFFAHYYFRKKKQKNPS